MPDGGGRNDPPERRIDSTNGQSYMYSEFLAYYGDAKGGDGATQSAGGAAGWGCGASGTPGTLWKGGSYLFTNYGAGGGGGSYNSGSNQDNKVGVGRGHGKVVITYVGN